jgi:alkylation response protein AidB-like acyl-CoA dehydrogenase
MLYRIAGLLDRSMDGRHDGGALLSALEEFAIESSIVKVAASETLDYVVDENVQIHGGNGFVRDYDAERHYRDARVNRIFEGTNEINRLLIPGMLVKRRLAMEAGFPALSAVEGSRPETRRPDNDALGAMKQAALLVLSTASEKFGDRLGEHQFVLLPAADILIDVFAADSVAARATGHLHEAAATVFLNDAADRVEVAARNALAAMLEGSELESAVVSVRGMFNRSPVRTTPLRDELAAAALSLGQYPFA